MLERRVQLAARTDRGQVREENQDSYLVVEDESGGLLAVCDGLGGHLGGREASELAGRVLQDAWRRSPRLELGVRIARAVRAAHEGVKNLARRKSSRGCGTTCVALAYEGNRFVLANVGDSRAYRIRGGRIEQLTIDHSFANELVAQGLAAPEAALLHPDAETLTRCLGMETRVDIDLCQGQIEPGDRFLLCSDGLYRHLSDVEMGQVVLVIPDPLAACHTLIAMANARGGDDNITAGVLAIG